MPIAWTDHRLFVFENVVASPHIAGMTDGALYNMAAAAADQWITIMNGGVPPRLVNPAAWSNYAERFQRLLGSAPTPL
jgi:D-3-phosphoglycerate dehydrogenase